MSAKEKKKLSSKKKTSTVKKASFVKYSAYPISSNAVKRLHKAFDATQQQAVAPDLSSLPYSSSEDKYRERWRRCAMWETSIQSMFTVFEPGNPP